MSSRILCNVLWRLPATRGQRYCCSSPSISSSISGHDEEEVDILDPQALKSATSYASFEELLQADPLNRKTWLAIGGMYHTRLLWCPREQQLVPIPFKGTDFFRDKTRSGLLLSHSSRKKSIYIRNPVTSRYTQIHGPQDDPIHSIGLAASAEQDVFFVASFHQLSYPRVIKSGPGNSFSVYSSRTREWEVVDIPKQDFIQGFENVVQGDDGQLWFLTVNCEVFRFYNPMLRTWGDLPRLPGLACFRMNYYKGRIYVINCRLNTSSEVADDDSYELDVYVFIEAAWKRLNHTRAKWIGDDHVTVKGSEGPYFCVYTLTLDDPAWVVVYDIDRNCWYFARKPYMEEVRAFTPNATIGETFLDSTY